MKTSLRHQAVITRQISSAQRVAQPTKSIANNRPSAIAQRQLQEKLAGRATHAAKLNQGNGVVTQRVVYKGQNYTSKERDAFVTLAQQDLVALGVQVSEPTKNFLAELVKNSAIFPTAESLSNAEHKRITCHEQIKRDIDETLKLTQLPALFDQLKESLEALPTEGALAYDESSQSKTTVNAIRAITGAIAEEKHQIRLEATITTMETSARAYVVTKRRTPQALKKLTTSIDALTNKVNTIQKDLYKQSDTNLSKGYAGYRYSGKAGIAGLSLTKLYIGQIEDTTEAKKAKVEKSRGILFSSPWSIGVNESFISGGIASSKVFKLKTDIPDNLTSYLKNGDIDGFKAAVTGKGDAEHRPFWHSLRNDFTTFSQEIVTLLKSGYRLHTFPRSDGKLQQLMALSSHKDDLATYYKTASQ